MYKTITDRLNHLQPVILGIGALIILAALTHWGGSPAPGLGFALGVAAMISTVFVFAFLVWWLLMSPLPARQQVAQTYGSAVQRQILVILIAISGLNFVVGAFWDEVWHRQYGVPFGEDFFWRPHIMMYLSLGLIALFALGGMLVIMRGQGSMRQRFRAQPLVGLLVLAAGFQSTTTPLDPVWHQLYGADISAWSIPHTILMLGFSLTIMAAVAIQRSLIRRDQWASLLRISPQEALIVVLLVFITLLAFQLGTSEWDEMPGRGSIFWERPQWLYPVIILSCAGFLGTFALRLLKRVGAATAVGLLALGARLLLLNSFDMGTVSIGINAYVLYLAPLVALDAWYALRLWRADRPPGALTGGLAAALGMLLVSVPLIPSLTPYPQISAATLPGIIVMGVIMALYTSWAGAALAGWMSRFAPQTAPLAETTRPPAYAVWLPAAVLVASLAFIVFFITTASPPV
jgi:hypothetical protein